MENVHAPLVLHLEQEMKKEKTRTGRSKVVDWSQKESAYQTEADLYVL